MSDFPEGLSYTAEHEWVTAPTADGVVRVGITDYAQESLGDVVFVSTPAAGTAVTAGAPFGEVESTKSVSDLYAPVTGEIVARNDRLDEAPELVNSDPFGDGWIVEIRLGPGTATPGTLMDATAYAAMVAQH